MNPTSILADLLNNGITPTVTPDGSGIEVPAGRLTADQRRAILAHKQELIARIQESARITAALIDAAARACDSWNDGPEARTQMHRDCLETPLHLRADLLAHFEARYPKKPSKAR